MQNRRKNYATKKSITKPFKSSLFAIWRYSCWFSVCCIRLYMCVEMNKFQAIVHPLCRHCFRYFPYFLVFFSLFLHCPESFILHLSFVFRFILELFSAIAVYIYAVCCMHILLTFVL